MTRRTALILALMPFGRGAEGHQDPPAASVSATDAPLLRISDFQITAWQIDLGTIKTLRILHEGETLVIPTDEVWQALK